MACAQFRYDHHTLATSTLPGDFLFSQHSLNDFRECPRRFFLKYIARQAWPAVESAPFGMGALDYRDYLRKGVTLHQWIERHWLGMPGPAEFDDDELALWWARFAGTDFSDLPARRDPELSLVAPLGRFRLYARFDLLASDSETGEFVIVDWKTLRGDKAPSMRSLRERIQTRAYLYVLTIAGAPFNEGRPIQAAQIHLRYWLANFPEQPWVTIEYTPAEVEADRRLLEGLVGDIAQRDGEAAFPKTDEVRRCAACAYRTLCQREAAAAPGDDPELDNDPPDERDIPQFIEY
jgi:CRISPR/Cas system-associated exonuclease Cas4 (RecB family)